ncbi:MAG: antitoxin family protein [Phycisphaerales bacterium]|nr:antitoxin family protein [Phycisphaerales bacterium]
MPDPSSRNFRIKAVFERGVFRPIGPVALPESATVDLDVHAGFDVAAAEAAKAWFLEAAQSGRYRASDGYKFNRDELYDRHDRD